MILRDEANTIREVIESAGFVDKIICGIDDRTKDDTEKICKEMGAETYTFDFNDSFAGSRNVGFDMVETEWILQLDGHEVMKYVKGGAFHVPSREDWEHLAAILGDDHDVASIQLWNNLRPSGIPGVIFFAPRIFRSNLRMEGNIHNYIAGAESSRSIAFPYYILLHDRNHDLEQQRTEQRKEINAKRLHEDVELDPKNARAHFYLAQTYVEYGDFKEAKKYYRLHQKKSKFESELYQGALQLARLELQDNQFKRAIKWLVKCESLQIPRNDHLAVWGDVYVAWFEYLFAKDGTVDREKLILSKQYYERAATMCVDVLADLPMNIPVTSHFVEAQNLTWYPHRQLMLVNDYLRDYERALLHCQKHLALVPDDEQAQKNLGKLEAVIRDNGKKRIVIFDSLQQFMQPLIDEWSKKHIVEVYPDFIENKAQHADVVWFEWCDKNAIQGTRRRIPGAKKIVNRIHRYELDAGYIPHVNWQNVDVTFTVSEFMKDIYMGQLNGTKPGAVQVLPNGIDLDKFTFRDRGGTGNKIAWLGYLNWKKGVNLLFMVAKMLPRYEIHVGGTFQQSEFKRMADYRNLGNVYFHGWVDANSFLEDKDLFLSTSVVESQHIAMFEAMAKGIKPLCYDWPGCKEWLPDELIWSTPEELNDVLQAQYDSNRYRQIVEIKANLERQLKTVNEVLGL
jgi:glycosyltransferase involved in cell wall biosynthesis